MRPRDAHGCSIFTSARSRTRVAYELDRGSVVRRGALQLVINDPWFAWLHHSPSSSCASTKRCSPMHPRSKPMALRSSTRSRADPPERAEQFARRYFEALQRQPAVIVAHAEVRRILKQASDCFFRLVEGKPQKLDRKLRARAGRRKPRKAHEANGSWAG